MRQGHYVNQLLQVIEAYRLEDRHPDEIEPIVLAAQHGMLSDAMAKAYLVAIEPWVDAQKRCWNGLPRAPDQEELGEYDIPLGELIERPGVRAGIRLLDRPRHILVSGATNSGKSTLLRRLVIATESLYSQLGRPINILVLDLKGDFVDIPDRLGRSRWRHYSIHDGFRIGLNSPTGFRSTTSWINQVTRIIAAHCGLIFSASSLASVMRFALPCLNDPPSNVLNWPSLSLILEILRRAPADAFATKKQYTEALIQRLDYLVENSEGLFDTSHGFDVIRDMIAPSQSQGLCAVIDLTVTSPLLINIIADLICSQILFWRMYERVTDGPMFFLVADEADTLCSAHTAALYPEGYTALGQTTKQGREFKIMTALAMTYLGNCSQFISSNSTYHFIFNQSDPNSTREASRTLHLDRGGPTILDVLDPGGCIYKESQGPFSRAMLLKVDYEKSSDAVRPDAFDQLPCNPAKSLNDPDMSKIADALDVHIAEFRRAKLRRTRPAGGKDGQRSKHAHELIHAMATHPWAPAKDLWKATGQTPTPSIQKAVRKELAEAGLALSQQIRLGRANVLLYQLQDDGWGYVNREPPARLGRGGIAHAHICAWISMVEEKDGAKTSCEWLAGNHPADCAKSAGNGLHDAYEVIVDCSSNLTKHLTALSQCANVRNIIVVCLQKKIIGAMQEKISSEPVVMALGDRLKWELAETYLRRLWP